MKTNQSAIIKEALHKHMELMIANKEEFNVCIIYTRVVDELGVPRPTVRRVAGDLRLELKQKIEILGEHLKPLVVT